MRTRRSTGESDDGAASGRFPMRGTEPCERRNEVHTVRRIDRARECFGLARLLDDAKSISQPLHGGPRNEDRRLESVCRPATVVARDGGQQSIGRGWPMLTSVEQKKGAGTVGVLTGSW